VWRTPGTGEDRDLKKPLPFGKYLLIERVNVGGMAEVYKAKTVGVEGFEKLLAIKRILPNIAEDDEFIAMFIDEAKISVQLTHANIAQIYDLGKIGESYFIALEYISGKDMRAIFDRMRKRGEPLPIPMTCFLIAKVCEGLDYAHRKKDAAGSDLNIVHRDISPQNVLVSFDGEVKLIDFGIAKAANKASRTQAGILKGKFGYMSPEQVRGLPLDRRSDVFAVGVCLYELLTSERLFVGESDFSTLEKVRNVDVVPPSTYNRRIPEVLENIVMKALAKDVDDRYQWCSELQDDLQRFLITSDSIFSRTDLSNFMKAVFAEDLEREKIKNQAALAGEATGPLGDEPGAPDAVVGDDATQLFDPTAQFDPSEAGPPPSPPSPPKGPAPRMPGPPGGPPMVAPSGPPRSPPVIPDLEIGNLADLEDDEEDGPPTMIEGKPPPLPGAPPVFDSPAATPPRRPPPSEPKAGRGRLPVFLGVGLFVALLAGAGIYFVPGLLEKPQTATGILIVRGSPSGARVYVNEQPVGQLPYIDSAASIGAYTLRVEADGYETFEDRVAVMPGETASVSVSLESATGAPATVLVVSVPLDARVRLNDEVVKEGGDAPWQSREIPSGVAHTIVVERDGYRPHTIEWTPEPGEEKTFTATLASAQVKLVVTSEPSRAQVFMDGDLKGRTPLTLDAVDASKRYRLEVKRGACFEDWSSTLIFDERSERTVHVDLDAIPGCGRRPGGRAPGGGGAAPAGGRTGGTAKQAAPQPQGTGQLSLNTRPGWAWVIINGRETGRHTPLVNYDLPAGDHTVLLRTPDGREQTVTVTIRPDEMTRQTVNME
jgi:serine/threonine protein kinase